MQTITTKPLPATATKPARIKATASGGGGSITISASGDESHMQAMRQLCNKLNWHGFIAGGHTNDGMVWVFLDEKLTVIIPQQRVGQ